MLTQLSFVLLKGIIMCWCIVENKAKSQQTAEIARSEGMEVYPSFSSTIAQGKLFQHITGIKPKCDYSFPDLRTFLQDPKIRKQELKIQITLFPSRCEPWASGPSQNTGAIFILFWQRRYFLALMEKYSTEITKASLSPVLLSRIIA